MDPTAQTSAAQPLARGLPARLAVAGTHAVVVVTVVEFLLVGAKYEDRVGWATHDTPALAVLNFLAAVVEVFLPLTTLLLVTGTVWVVTVLAAAVAFVRWLRRAARDAGLAHGWASLVNPYRMVRDVHAESVTGAAPAPVGRWWAALLATAPLVVAAIVLRAAVVHQEIGGEQLRDARVLTYPLGILTVAGVWYTAVLSRRVVRRITHPRAHRDPGGGGS
jgi:hypothetical protein